MRRNFLVHGNRPGAEARIQRNFHRELPYPFPLTRERFYGSSFNGKVTSAIMVRPPIRAMEILVEGSSKNERILLYKFIFNKFVL